MRISLAELEQCLNLAFEHLRSEGFESVDSGDLDYYRNVLSDDWSDFSKQPEPAVGSLEDDISALKKLSTGGLVMSAIDLERLAAVLRLLAENLLRR